MKQNSVIIVFMVILCSAFIRCNENIGENLNITNIEENLAAHGFALPPGFNNITVPSFDDIKKIVVDKCEHILGSEKSAEAYNEIEEAAKTLFNCTSNLFDYETAQNEYEEARKNKSLETVFNKYCGKRSLLLKCAIDFGTVGEKCLNETEIAAKETFVRIFKNLLEFVCHKEGDQIALFISEKGPECLKETQNNLTQCFNSSIETVKPSETEIGVNNFTSTLPFILSPNQCKEIDNLESCVVKSLLHCQETTPSNLAEAMFKFVRNETVCKKSSAATTTSTSVTALVIGTAVYLALIFIPN